MPDILAHLNAHMMILFAPAPAPPTGINQFKPNGPDYGTWSGAAPVVVFIGGAVLGLAAIVSLVLLLVGWMQLAFSNKEHSNARAVRSIKKNAIVFVASAFFSTVAFSWVFGLLNTIVSKFHGTS